MLSLICFWLLVGFITRLEILFSSFPLPRLLAVTSHFFFFFFLLSVLWFFGPSSAPSHHSLWPVLFSSLILVKLTFISMCIAFVYLSIIVKTNTYAPLFITKLLIKFQIVNWYLSYIKSKFHRNKKEAKVLFLLGLFDNGKLFNRMMTMTQTERKTMTMMTMMTWRCRQFIP